MRKKYIFKIVPRNSKSLLSSKSNYSLDSLLSQKQTNIRQQRMSCVLSPTECFRHVDIGHIIDARIAAEKVRQRENKDEVGLKVMNSILLSFFNIRYRDYQIVEERPGYIHIRPKVVKGRVLSFHDFWEDIEIKTFISVNNRAVDIVIVVDGRFAAGLSPPVAKSDYVDFEIAFSQEIDEYTKSLASSLNRFIVRTNDFSSKREFPYGNSLHQLLKENSVREKGSGAGGGN